MTATSYTPPPEDGGPAFPFIEPSREWTVNEGMSLRDHFAGLAMQAMLTNAHLLADLPTEKKLGQRRVISALAYKQADSMLEARKS